MKLLKFLASVTVCIAFDSGVESSRDVRPDSHSIRKGRALSDESMQINDKAKDGKSDMTEEERHITELFASVGHYLGRPAAKENAELSEKLLPKATGKDKVAANEQKITGKDKVAAKEQKVTGKDKIAANKQEVSDLFEQVNEGQSNLGPRLMQLVVEMQKVGKSRKFADTTMVTMVKNPKTMDLVVDEWIKSGKTPDEVSEFLLQHVKGRKWIGFVRSDLFDPWLTYISRSYTELKSNEQDTRTLAESVDRLFYTGHNAKEINEASAKAEKTADGEHVVALISTIRES